MEKDSIKYMPNNRKEGILRIKYIKEGSIIKINYKSSIFV